MVNLRQMVPELIPDLIAKCITENGITSGFSLQDRDALRNIFSFLFYFGVSPDIKRVPQKLLGVFHYL